MIQQARSLDKNININYPQYSPTEFKFKQDGLQKLRKKVFLLHLLYFS